MMSGLERVSELRDRCGAASAARSSGRGYSPFRENAQLNFSGTLQELEDSNRRIFEVGTHLTSHKNPKVNNTSVALVTGTVCHFQLNESK